MSELSDILNAVYKNRLVIGAGVLLLGIPSVALVHTASKVVNDYRSAPKIIQKCEEQFSEETSRQELYGLYNQLLPASRCTFRKNRKKADVLVNQVESVLCNYILKEIQGLPKKMSLNERIEKSKTFQETFLKHHYNSTSQPGDSINYVMDRLSTLSI